MVDTLQAFDRRNGVAACISSTFFSPGCILYFYFEEVGTGNCFPFVIRPLSTDEPNKCLTPVALALSPCCICPIAYKQKTGGRTKPIRKRIVEESEGKSRSPEDLWGSRPAEIIPAQLVMKE